jgi:hypothetical protein
VRSAGYPALLLLELGPSKFDFGALTHIAAFNEALPKRRYEWRIGLSTRAQQLSVPVIGFLSSRTRIERAYTF